MPESLRDAILAEALRANNRYLEEFLEAYAFCPFARGGRLAGTSIRRTHYYDGKEPDALLEMMVEVAADKDRVVTQVILPLIDVAPQSWRDFCHLLTDRGHERLGGDPVLAVAPLHPNLSYQVTNANTVITLFRRTPDPTIQWVRLDALAEIYEGRTGSERFVPPERVLEVLLQGPARPGLYERIAETNLAMARRLGFENIERLLREISEQAQENYKRLILCYSE